mmetsp:Transcript_12478/g.39490  ORF Transcript_12478/g.39490 Transcript_12478/m.39490 type:complete len:249 (-) Transcript_12478:1812-2558(-)
MWPWPWGIACTFTGGSGRRTRGASPLRPASGRSSRTSPPTRGCATAMRWRRPRAGRASTCMRAASSLATTRGSTTTCGTSMGRSGGGYGSSKRAPSPRAASTIPWRSPPARASWSSRGAARRRPRSCAAGRCGPTGSRTSSGSSPLHFPPRTTTTPRWWWETARCTRSGGTSAAWSAASRRATITALLPATSGTGTRARCRWTTRTCEQAPGRGVMHHQGGRMWGRGGSPCEGGLCADVAGCISPSLP